MPWLLANGLLPGRAAPGRGIPAPGLTGSVGVPSGLAAGASAAGALSAAAAFSAAWAWRSATVSGAAGAGAAGVAGTSGTTVVSTGSATRGPGRAPGLARVGRDAPGFTGVGAADAACTPVPDGVAAGAPSAWRAARRRRATGGSMLEDGPLTNSPISFNFARATLLSTLNSLAISCTRGFAATILLFRACTRKGADR
jgi:hypothetical protein